MRNEQHAQIEGLLKISQKIHDLRLHRYVQRADCFVGNEDLRANGEGARYCNALPLAPGELTWVLRRDRG
jgi:hypothetical protein